MKIHTFKVDEYRKCKVYYRNFGETFEYLTIIKKELYTTHIRIIPTLINRFLYWFGIEKSLYSRQQQEKILKQLRVMAETTVDFILDKEGDNK
jgi:hypothetical protein